MQVKHWLHKILATIMVRLSMYVAGRIDYDILCEVTEKEAERVRVYQTCEHTCGTCGGMTYEQLKKIEDEWYERGIIR
ncbi:MAG: hypothetical protein Q8J68_07780 [Methanolobus sp.]|uniref:hypothetical protein n=1 Tax=Methanolobus sp. TaxID=1874737 RepID=UPI002730C16E|nr:hypothetical protein [Methanolobus sp.]MDP2217167.1 hypothetical protein [Methanolobus sp.]